jgi:diacylglycerol kinase
MSDEPNVPERSWKQKFGDAFSGIRVGIEGQSSFRVHALVAIAVVIAGVALRVSLIEWCGLLLCIVGVVTAELFNSAMESMAKAITHENHPHLGNSLDIASAAVLVASFGAAIVGLLIFGNRIAVLLDWW